MSSETWLWMLLGVAVMLAVGGVVRYDLLGLMWRDAVSHAPERAGQVAPPAVLDETPRTTRVAPHPIAPRRPAYHRSGRRG
jgi:hypothetical protein